MINLKETKHIPKADVLALYQDANWLAYTSKPEQLIRAIGQSLLVVSAWHGNELAGLIRVVGDGETIIYVQDILVKKQFKRQGIGTRLLQAAMQRFAHVRQLVLLTDDTAETRGFYEAMGLVSCDRGQLVAFAKLSNE